MSDQIKLDDCPEILRDAVKAELAKWDRNERQAEILSCTLFKSSYTENTNYKVYLLVGNLFIILDYTDTPPERYNLGVIINSVTAGEIMEIIRAMPDCFKY